jgi:hypothetical protein
MSSDSGLVPKGSGMAGDGMRAPGSKSSRRTAGGGR